MKVWRCEAKLREPTLSFLPTFLSGITSWDNPDRAQRATRDASLLSMPRVVGLQVGIDGDREL